MNDGAWTGYDPFDEDDCDSLREWARVMFLEEWATIARELAEWGCSPAQIDRALEIVRDEVQAQTEKAIASGRALLTDVSPGTTQVH